MFCTQRDADCSVRVGIASSGGMLLDAEARRRGETRGEHVRISFSPWTAAQESKHPRARSQRRSYGFRARLTLGVEDGPAEPAPATAKRVRLPRKRLQRSRVRWRSEYPGVDASYGRGRLPVAPVSSLPRLVPGGRSRSGSTEGAARGHPTSPGALA